MSKTKKTNLLFVLLGLVYSGSSFADINCTGTDNAFADTVALGGTITVGDDIPDGTVLYNAQYRTNGYTALRCDSPTYTLANWVDYGSKPMPLSTWSSGALGGKVYQTNIAGIGAVVTGLTSYGSIGGAIFPRQETTYKWVDSKGGNISHGYQLWLIKIGPVAAGAVNGAILPTVESYIPATSGFTGLPITIGTVKFSGSINIVKGTCSASDVTVNMGTHNLVDFSGVGSTSAWKDASIILTNCSRFHGTYGSANTTVQIKGSGSFPTGTPNFNTFNVYLQPTSTEVLDAANGILNINAPSGDTAAVGFGIEVGWGEASGSPSVFNFNNPQSFTAPNDGSTTIRIPLAARYIQTQTSVMPGIANGRVTFVVDYM
ncbi:fimbrial protein [Klebsiella huaxiensis]|uniref:Type-1 fimbrial protein, A chain n=1 Tax=Klebsiella huaxiensis TaxID=2153354 RepID=A0A564NA03_9ENTR|nr:fimbrial protein [Klebsiella huaxiensis]VUT03176.1 Type-1 fimbrial protein, A chain [Klebsiella huaxiensis]VUT23382.1 Type-1 fimbrial protein, A chain [Klebsiella huaxiensis]